MCVTTTCCEEKGSCGCVAAELNDELDCDGVLSLWFCGSVFEEWESIEGGGGARGGELLFAGVVVSAQSKCDSQSDDCTKE